MKWLLASVGDFEKSEYDYVYANLSPSRKRRVDRYKREEDRIRSLLCELLLKKILCGLGEEKAVLETADNGRPFLKNSSLFVSMSHSEEKAVCAVSEKEIGIDIERIKPINSALIDRVCTRNEMRYVMPQIGEKAATIENRAVLERFYEVWTAKEAYFKKMGTGITDLKSVDVTSLEKKVIIEDDYLITII